MEYTKDRKSCEHCKFYCTKRCCHASGMEFFEKETLFTCDYYQYVNKEEFKKAKQQNTRQAVQAVQASY